MESPIESGSERSSSIFSSLGNDSTLNSVTPSQVRDVTNVSEIAAGAGNSCALLTDETIDCWGELGDGSNSNSQIPVEVNGI
jgi:hypothetical protein